MIFKFDIFLLPYDLTYADDMYYTHVLLQCLEAKVSNNTCSINAFY